MTPANDGRPTYDPAADRAADQAHDDDLRAQLVRMANSTGNLFIRPEDLDRLYDGRDDERAELFDLCHATAARKADEADRLEQHMRLGAATDRVLAEWDKQRRADAEAEARRRLDGAE